MDEKPGCSPEIHEDLRVSFRLFAPDANSIRVRGGWMEELGLEYTYRESSGGHTWSNWRIYLSELAPLLFQ